MAGLGRWEKRGQRLESGVWYLDVAPRSRGPDPEPVLILHGFPTCSYDWRHVLDSLAAHRQVILLDFLGFGLSAKPDQPYSLFAQADRAVEVVTHLGLEAVALVSHDMGNSVGGELLARNLDGDLPFTITRRVLTNGSIYLDLANLTDGQKMLAALADERIPPGVITEEGFGSGLAQTFGPRTQPSAEELADQWVLMHRDDGECLLPRLIRYLGERQQYEERWTGAIETHPSPLHVVWGDRDPVAVIAMTERLRKARPDARIQVLPGVGHYPMIEVPGRFARAVLSGLDSRS